MNSNVELQKEVELLRERVELLERVKHLESEVDLSDDTLSEVDRHVANLREIRELSEESV